MELWEILIIVPIVLVVLIVVVLLFRGLKRKKQETEANQAVNDIVDLFGLNNIIGVEQTQKRVRVEVKDLTLVDLEGLNPYTNGIFTIGNKVVVTFKENTEKIVKSLGARK